MAGPEKVRHFHLDHLGTPRLITGNGGAIIAERTYGAFGRGLIVDSTPPPHELAQFTAHERDTFQLDYMHARYYEPMLGRFLSVDPVLDIKLALHEPQLRNRYSYVTNNPLTFTDPDGRYRTFYKEKPMTAENLAMDENTPVAVRYSMYATGGLTALGAGGGGTAGALKNEIATGVATAGRFHLQAGLERLSSLQKLIAGGTLSSRDLASATRMARDLQQALQPVLTRLKMTAAQLQRELASGRLKQEDVVRSMRN
ncbi:MAG TPA: RHS repeat-associated core domain-containing protein [Thermoanaerobaculia bacterium]|nr:RHS repeat-associated core domain-containing protein [Thermoanaerobaculia bacterium]